MVVVARRPAPPLVQGRAADDLSLKIVNTKRAGQLICLTSPKCTIGSGRGCTLRLRAAGVRPLHCILLRGMRGTVVRSWSPDTRLNGRAFSDAVLAMGDRLAIGPIELEVVPASQAEVLGSPGEVAARERSLGAARAELAAVRGQLDEARDELAALGGQLEFERGQLAAQRSLLAKLQAETGEADRQVKPRETAMPAERQPGPSSTDAVSGN